MKEIVIGLNLTFSFSYFLLPVVFAKALSYIVVLMMSAIDFWIVKNIVGRKLIKMRWWYIIDNEGNERWHFESRGKNLKRADLKDKLIQYVLKL